MKIAKVFISLLVGVIVTGCTSTGYDFSNCYSGVTNPEHRNIIRICFGRELAGEGNLSMTFSNLSLKGDRATTCRQKINYTMEEGKIQITSPKGRCDNGRSFESSNKVCEIIEGNVLRCLSRDSDFGYSLEKDNF